MTEVTDLGANYWTEELLSKIPRFWSSDEARTPGATNDDPNGNIWSYFRGIADMLERENQALVFAFQATRIQTAVGTGLDLAAADFFGYGLPRKIGEPDDAYRIRILAALLQSKVARDPVQQIVEQFTGATVRMIQADSPRDCGGYRHAYYNADSATTPARYASSFHKNIGFMDIQLPAQSGPVARYGYNAGAAYNAYTGVYWIPTPSNLITPDVVAALIMGVIGWPMRIGVRFGKTLLPLLIAGLVEPVNATIETIRPRIFPPFAGIYYVFATSGSVSPVWWDDVRPSNFGLQFGAPQPPDSILSYLALSRGVPGVGQSGVQPTKEEVIIPFDTANRSLAVLPNWNTTPYIASETPTGATVVLRAPSPGALVNTLTYPHGPYAGRVQVTAGAGTKTYTAPTGPNFIVLVTPNWGTDIGVTPRAGNQVDLFFSVEAPAGAWVDWISYPLTTVPFYGNTVPILLEHHSAVASVLAPIAEPFATFVNATYISNAWSDVLDLLNVEFDTSIDMPDDETLHFLLLSHKVAGANSVPMGLNNSEVSLLTNQNLNVVVACANWNTVVYSKSLDPQNLKLECAVGAPPSGGVLSYLVYPKGVNAGRISVPKGRLDFTFDANSDEFHIPLVTPNWNTSVAIIPLANNLIQVKFAVAAPDGATFDYVTFPLT